ncbi:MAG: carbohydrate binding family 9 domain-containing protein, partial [Gammaproteobacteria bacterium]|nr:carbohydrate binding family 9 domain-containing protein [Gammaproteobacteria bacterium]
MRGIAANAIQTVVAPVTLYDLLVGRLRSKGQRFFLAAALWMTSGPLQAEPLQSIPALDTPPDIDGILDDEAWKQAAVISDFTQVEPVEGAAPSERTEVYLGYDADTIYVAFRCHHAAPDSIVARRLRDDDSLTTDDSVFIAFDTFRDRRNAFLFAINALGTKRDARIEDNLKYRQEWDGIWFAEARRDAGGWTAEMAIPVKTLSFTPGTREWGLNISRMIRRNNEWVRWTNISQDRDFADVASFGELMGMEGLDQGLGLDLRPSLAGRFTWNEDAGDQDLRLRPGGEVVYKVTPSLNASLVINPDFSDATVDDVQTNLTRFSLFFPEQRHFFVRDADIFEFGGLVGSEDVGLPGANALPFFSRRIGLLGDIENPEIIDLDAGVKLSGRLGRYTLGFLNTQMNSFRGIESKNLSVARAAVDVLEESRAGMIFTYGDPFTDNDNAVAGADFRYRDSDVFNGRVFEADVHVMASSTSGVRGDELAFGLSLKYPNDIWNGRANFTEIQENFNPALGFVNRSGVRKYAGELRRRFRPSGGAWFRTMDFGLMWEFFTNTDNELE